jgi:hypothetical protein
MHNTNLDYSKLLQSICCILLITIKTATADNNSTHPQKPTDYLYTFDLSTFDYHDINAILKYGNSREKQLVIQYLLKERYNPEKLDLLISYYIHNDRNDLAKYWVKWGRDNNIKIKPWQILHLAIIQKDKNTINHIIANEESTLPESMINDALSILNKDNNSLSKSNYIITTAFSENYGALDIDSANITGGIKNGEYEIIIAGMKNLINFNDNGTFHKEHIEDELDLSINVSKRIDKNIFSFGIGNNNRVFDDITYTLLKYEYQYSEEILSIFAIEHNKISYTSPALRALGYKNLASIGLRIKPATEYTINVGFNSHEYKTRKHDPIGSGYSINASLNRIMSYAPSYWDVSIRTSVEDNNLKSSIPSYIATSQIKQPDDIVSDHYSFIGFGTIYKYGFLDNSSYLTNNISINIYTGLIYPDESVNFGLDIKYGYAFTPLSLLGFEAVYSNAFNSIEGNDYTKLTLYYKYHF